MNHIGLHFTMCIENSNLSRVSFLWRRFVAICIDFSALIFGSFILAIAANICTEGLDENSKLWIITYVLQLLLIVFFCVNGSNKRASLGLRAMKFVVLANNGHDLSKTRAFIRLFIGLLTSPLFPISFCILFFCPKRSLADILCYTITAPRILQKTVPNNSIATPTAFGSRANEHIR